MTDTNSSDQPAALATAAPPPKARIHPERRPTILRTLDLSTAHLPESLAGNDGDLPTHDGVTADRLDYGWLLWVPQDPDRYAADYDDIPPEVLTIQRYAQRHGCDRVLLDPDAATVPDLPTWEWR